MILKHELYKRNNKILYEVEKLFVFEKDTIRNCLKNLIPPVKVV